MPATYLWGIGNQGRAYALSTDNQMWELRSSEYNTNRILGFKRVSSARHVVWALASNQQPYIYVFARDVPIRCLEYTYENQRWGPVRGFSEKSLIFSDRPPWSDEKGARVFPRPGDVRLPNKHWKWESDWHVDENFKGQPTGKGGWQYAVTFNTNDNYTSEKKWNSCVRRRKWIRYRKYIATNAWAQVQGINADPLEEPLMDLAVGGRELPGQSEGYLSVWAISALGKVFCRVGVTRKNPEGSLWREVYTSEGKGLIQLSVGPNGVVWGVTWDGQGVIRMGVSRDHPLGTNWTYVDPPEKGLLSSIALGNNVVWAITRDQKVWFRKGFMSTEMKETRSNRAGTSWIEMCGQVAQLSVGPNDQVWALTADDRRTIVFRSGVSYEELSGREWKSIIIAEKDDQRYFHDDAISVADSVVSQSVSISGKMQYLLDVNHQFSRSVSDPAGLSLMGYDSSTPSFLGEEFMHNGKLVRTMCMQTECQSIASSMVALHTGFEDSMSGSLQNDVRTSDRKLSLGSASNPGVPEIMPKILEPSKIEDVPFPEVVDPVNCVPFPEVLESETCLICQEEAQEKIAIECDDKDRSDTESEDPQGLTVEDVHSLTPVSQPLHLIQRQPSYHSDVSDTPINYITDYDDDSVDNLLPDSGSEKGTQTDRLLEGVELLSTALTSSDLSMNPVRRLQLQSHQATSTTGIPDSVENEERRLYQKRKNSSPEFRIVIADHNEKRKNSSPEVRFMVGDHNSVPDLSDSESKTLPAITVNDFDHRQMPGRHLPLHASYSRHHSHLYSRMADSPVPMHNQSMVDLSTAVEEEEETLWMWVSGGGCVVEPTSLPKWFYQATLSQQSFRHRLQEGPWRGNVLRLLRKRRDEENKGFEHYPSAVERSTWAKVGRLQWYSEGRRRQWTDCTIELERGVDGTGRQQSRFSLHHQAFGKRKSIRFLLSEVTYVLEVNNGSEYPSFCIYTPKRVLDRKPITLRAKSDKELVEWVAAISLACSEVRGIYGAPSCRASWMVTCRGDVFIHETLPNMLIAPSSHLYWRQIGGHLAYIECCGANVVWGLGLDHTPWVYSGGYGGGVFKGIYSSTVGIQPQTDSMNLYVFEVQRWSPLSGFTDRGLWFSDNNKVLESRDSVPLPSSHWQWISDWKVDFTISGSTDKEGWQYAKEIKNAKAFHKDRRWNDYVRRRRWVRRCQISTTGPWEQIQNLSLRVVSLQVDVDEDYDSPISLWAIGVNGDVVTRLGVTADCPKGTAWMHVPTDQPFQSITVGGSHRVWAVARDGSAFYRNGITDCNRTGDTWFHIAPPPVAPLKQISAGMSAVWAIDTQMNLWYRQDITPTFPEGTRWIQVSPRVRKVCVGPQDQVWILADQVDGAKGVICRRDGISEKKPMGSAWDKGAGGGIMHLCIRACTKEQEKVSPPVEDVAMTTVQGGLTESKKSEDAIRPYTSSEGNALC